nr:13355_t:CDS:2 [Entrophospora candida]
MSDLEHSMKHVESPKVFNPYKSQKSHLFKLKGSVLPNVIGSSVIITLFSAGIVSLYEFNQLNLRRRLWATMVVAIRNFTRFIWVHIDDNNTTKIILEKKTAINLLTGFAVATKHFLREEDGCLYDDIRPLISNIHSALPGFNQKTTFVPTRKRLTLWDQLLHRTSKPHLRADKESGSDVNHNLPLEICLYLSSYVHDNAAKNRITAPVTTNMLNCINTMVDCLSQFERVLRSPIPLAYSIHLAQTVWIYCLSLPFQLMGTAHWATIPIVFFACVVLLGIERIGAEIENPFGYDDNDLPLDDFCGIIKYELNTIASHPVPTIDDWVFTDENHPFENQRISALDAKHFSTEEVRSLLSINEKNESFISNERISLTIDKESEKAENGERELYAWQAMLRASGCHNITPWTQDESKLQLWTKSPDHITEKSTIHSLYKMGFLKALKGNKKNQDGKRRTLSIIANDFTYQELKTNLNVRDYD